MSGTNLLFVVIGSVSLVIGLGVLFLAIRGGPGTSPQATAMLIGGMMMTAFGLLMAGFAIAYSTAEPLNAEAAQ